MQASWNGNPVCPLHHRWVDIVHGEDFHGGLGEVPRIPLPRKSALRALSPVNKKKSRIVRCIISQSVPAFTYFDVLKPSAALRHAVDELSDCSEAEDFDCESMSAQF